MMSTIVINTVWTTDPTDPMILEWLKQIDVYTLHFKQSMDYVIILYPYDD